MMFPLQRIIQENLLCFVVLALQTVTSFTQSAEAQALSPTEQQELNLYYQRMSIYAPDLDINEMPSLFLTNSEENLIIDARLGLITRPPTESEFEREQNSPNNNVVAGPRELSLGGILYVSSNDWVIWFNGEKITPHNIPAEIIDVRVTKGYMRLKWFDSSTNQIYPIKLRPHQRFNLDTRIFLPG